MSTLSLQEIPSEALSAVTEELRRLRRLGLDSVYLADETWAALQESSNRARQSAQIAKSIETTRSTRSDRNREAPSAAERAAVNEKTGQKVEPAPATGALESIPPKTSGNVAPIPEPIAFSLPAGDKRSQWEWLRARVLECPTCNAHARIDRGKRVVFGIGNLDASIFFCGEAPGADEEEQGEPFVGKAGQLLTKIIQAMGLSRQDVYIGNIMNWRPEMPNMVSGNRPPTHDEMRFCLPYLIAQLEIVRPKVIVALGNTAVTGLLGPDPTRRMAAIRGSWLEFRGIPMIPTYHPSYLLRYANAKTKRQVWEDMLSVMERVNLPISDKQRRFFLEPT